MTAVIVTGAAGFIGAALAQRLSGGGSAVVGVENWATMRDWSRLADPMFREVISSVELVSRFEGVVAEHGVNCVYHLGASTDTQSRDVGAIMSTNHDYTINLMRRSADMGVRFVYASSASVYGNTRAPELVGRVPTSEQPLSPYALSKLLVDRHVRARQDDGEWAQTVGLRFFNVYGGTEHSKGAMASFVFKAVQQARASGVVDVFGASHGREAGEHRRDFIHISSVLDALEYFGTAEEGGIHDVGTGTSRSFNDVAAIVCERVGGEVRYVPMPTDLQRQYQFHTVAEVPWLEGRAARERVRMLGLEDGIGAVVTGLAQ